MITTFDIPCEEFLKGYRKEFFVICYGGVYKCVHDGIIYKKEGTPAVKFLKDGVAHFPVYIIPEEWDEKVFNSFEDVMKFLSSKTKLSGIKPKFGKWYRCKDVLPELGEWVLAQPEKGCIYYAKRMSGNQVCTGCLSDSYDWHWVYFAYKCNEEHRMTYFAGYMKYWMPLPTGDEPVEEINN